MRRCLLRRERSPTGSSRSSVALFRALRTHSLVWEMRLLPIIVALVAFWSWRGAFISLAIVTFIWLISWIISYKDDPRDHSGMTEEELEGVPIFEKKDLKVKAEPTPWRALIKRMGPTMGVYFCYGWTSWLFYLVTNFLYAWSRHGS